MEFRFIIYAFDFKITAQLTKYLCPFIYCMCAQSTTHRELYIVRLVVQYRIRCKLFYDNRYYKPSLLQLWDSTDKESELLVNYCTILLDKILSTILLSSGIRSYCILLYNFARDRFGAQ